MYGRMQLREALNTLSTSEDAARRQRDTVAAENTKLKSQLAALHEVSGVHG